jgi:hypothetical protein
MPRAFDEGHGGENFSPQEFLRLSIFFGMSLSPFGCGKWRLQATDIFNGKFLSFLLKDSFLGCKEEVVDATSWLDYLADLFWFVKR